MEAIIEDYPTCVPGNIVVRTRTSGSGVEGDMHRVVNSHNNTYPCEKAPYRTQFAMQIGHWRHAKIEEVTAFHKGITSIDNIPVNRDNYDIF